MSLKIENFEPASLPVPYSSEFEKAVRSRIKQLGISPAIDNGIRAWRVLWRPFLPQPEPYVRFDGVICLKFKADNVCTRRFPIVGETTEEEAFRQAAVQAATAYRMPVAKVMPLVHWGRLASAKGVKIRTDYAKPALNGALDKALELFSQGYGPSQVAEQMGVDRSTASRWRKRLRKENALP